MAVTIYDIAGKAGVSIATVSRVFNDSSTVSTKTRERVLNIANELGYHPQAHAQGLASKKSNTIMAVVPVMSNYFFIEVLSGIQDHLQSQKYDLNIFNVTPGKNIFEQVEKALKRRMAEGYLLISTHLTAKQWKELEKYDSPITLVDDYSPNFDSVSVDNHVGAYRAVQQFVNNGFRNIAIISASTNAIPVQQRVNGCKAALKDFGIKATENSIYFGDTEEKDGFTERAGYEAMIKVLTADQLYDACFCTSDIQAVGAQKAMQDLQKHLPLIGYDDIEFAEYLGLSTVRQPMRDMGFYATQILIDRLENPDRAISKTIYSPELILRGSTEELKTIPTITPDDEQII